MQKALQNRVFAVVTIAAMLLGSLSAVLVPATASAATAGDLIKGESLSTVYYYAPDGERYTFPNEKTYMTWYQDFDSVETITDSELADITLGGNIVYRPGTNWIKIQSDPKVYAVAADGTIHWIESEEVAVDYAGADWATMVHDVPDVFFVDYDSGTSLTAATAYDGMLYMEGSDYYISWDGEKRMVSDLDANNLTSDMFLMGEGIDDSALTDGDEVAAADAEIVDASQQGGVEEVVAVEGDLTITVASSTPSSVTIPSTANGVEVATFGLTADEDMTVGSIAVKIGGLVADDATSDDGAYLYEGDERLTEGRSFNDSTDKATFGALNLALEAGVTRYISVVVDMSGTVTTGSFYMMIESGDDIGTDGGEVSGSFPVSANTMSITSLTVGGLTIAKTGSVVNPTLGAADAVISKFNLEASAVEDIAVDTMTLKIDNAVDHTGYAILQNDVEVATGESIGSDLVLFTFSEAFEIENSKNKNFEVIATVGGEAAENIKVYLDNDADLKATGGTYGFNVAITRIAFDGGVSSVAADGASCAATTSDCSYTTIQGGDVTIALNGPSADDVAAGAEDHTLLDFSITSEEWVEIDDLGVNIAATDISDLSDVRLVNYDTGLLLSGPETAAASITFTDNIVIEAGETLRLIVTGDIHETTSVAGDTYTATFDYSDLDIDNVSGDDVTDVNPAADQAAKAQTVRTASLVVSLASTPDGDSVVVKGSEDIDTVAFNFEAGLGGDIEVTDITATVYVDEDSTTGYTAGTSGTTLATTLISSCSLYDTLDVLVAGPKAVSSATTGEILFENFSWTIPAGNTQKLYVRCNIGTLDPGTTDEFAVEILAAATDVIALDDDGDSVTPSGSANTAEGVEVSVASSGSVAISIDGSTPDSDIVLMDTVSNHVATFELDATNEDYEVKTLSFAVTGTTYENNVGNVTIVYPDTDDDGVAETATTSLGAGEAKFALSDNPIFVDKDTNTEVEVYVDISDTDDATTNEPVTIELFLDTTNDDNFAAYGIGSGEKSDDDTIDTALSSVMPLGNTFVVKESVPTISVSSSSPSGVKIPGTQEVFRFNVAASAAQDVVVETLTWKIESTDNDGETVIDKWNQCTAGDADMDDSDFTLYKTSDLSTPLDTADTDWTLLDATYASCGAGEVLTYITLTLPTAQTIAAGDTETYSLYMNTTSASSSDDDVLQVSLPSISTYVTASTLTANITTTTATLAAVASGTAYQTGDVILIGTEKMLVVGIATNDLTVVRGYLGTTAATHSSSDAATRLPEVIKWTDGASGDDWSAHLVDTIPAMGGPIQF